MANNIGNVVVQPYFLRTPAFYMIGQERQRHNEAIMAYGEYTMFALLWNAIDFDAGLVQHCPNCYSTIDGISDTYNQSSDPQCIYC